MIRNFQKEDNEQVMKIWLSGNEDAHSFIPKEYWRSNYPIVKEQISKAEVFVDETGTEIRGFIGIVNNYIAGIFVDKKYRSHGLGKQLLDYVKQKYTSLSLGVYEKNKRAVAFYLREDFFISSEGIEETTGEVEYTMSWRAEEERNQDWERLYEAARNVQGARKISDYIEAGQVGAALMTKNGNIYTGICIDTSCSLGMCAERNAIAHMLTCGENEIEKLAVVTLNGNMVLPCGVCCEFMMQLGEKLGKIEILTDYQKMEVKQLGELFPNWWGKKKVE